MVDRVETDVSPFKPGGRFVDESGTLTGEAYRFLDQIWKRTGGFEDGAWDTSAIAESLQTQISELNTTVEGLLAERQFADESRALDLLQRIEALEASQSEMDFASQGSELVERIEALEAGLADTAEVSESALRLASNVGKDAITVKELTDGRIPVSINEDGVVLIDGYPVNNSFSSSPPSLTGITDANSTGVVLARVDLDDVRAINLWSLLGTDIVFGSHGTGTMAPGDTASFELEVWYTAPDASPVASGGNFGSVGVTAYQVAASGARDWSIILDNTGAIDIKSELVTGNPTITNDELNDEIGLQNIKFPATALGASHIYLVGRWIGTTAASSTGIVLRFTTGTTLTATNLLNRSVN